MGKFGRWYLSQIERLTDIQRGCWGSFILCSLVSFSSGEAAGTDHAILKSIGSAIMGFVIAVVVTSPAPHRKD